MTAQVVLLAIIALAVTVMTTMQVVAALRIARLTKDVAKTIDDLRRDVAPLLVQASRIADDAARVTALALTQIQRIDRVVHTSADRIDEIVEVAHTVVTGPVRQGAALVAGLRAAWELFASRQRRLDPDDDEDSDGGDQAMFIG
jgi:uncharacterized protein YoxC